MAMRAVDLDLFVNSASKGWNDGAKVPTPFAAFLGGLSDGINQYYDNEQKAQQTEASRVATQRAEDLAPYEATIRQAEAEKAKLTQQAMQEDPEAFKDSIITKAQMEKKALEQQAALQQKATTFTDIMSKGTSAEKAQATLGGEYQDLFAAKPEYYKMAERSVPSWDASDKDKFWENDRQKVTSAYYAQRELTDEAQFLDAQKNFNKDTGVTTLANTLRVPVPYLLNDGEVRRELVGELKKEPVIDPKTGKQAVAQTPLSNAGTPQFTIKPRESGEQKWQDVFYYKGQPVYGTDPETLKVFSAYQEPWKIRNKKNIGQDGTGDIKKASDEVDNTRAIAQSEAEAQANTTNNNNAQNRERFYSGMGISPRFSSAKKEVDAQEAANKAEATATPNVPAINAALNGKAPLVVSPVQKTQAPAQPTGQTLTPTPTVSPSPTTAPSREREELNRAKARAAMQRRRPEGSPDIGSPQATPRQQAANASEPKTIPANVGVNISREPPDENVVEKVLSRPELEYSSALIKAVTAVESGGNPGAVSPSGVTGLMQTTLDTARDVDPTIRTRSQLRDPRVSKAIGSVRLQSLLRTYEKAPMVALIGYNAGPGVAKEIVNQVGVEATWEQINAALPSAVSKYYGTGEAGKSKLEETRNYPRRVMAYFPKFLKFQSDMQLADTLKEQGILTYA